MAATTATQSGRERCAPRFAVIRAAPPSRDRVPPRADSSGDID